MKKPIGRPLKHGEKTRVIRVPCSLILEIEKFILQKKDEEFLREIEKTDMGQRCEN